MPKRTTPFQRWYLAHGEPAHYDLAGKLGCSESSIRVYLSGRAIPRPAVLRKLTKLTGLPSDAFLFPFEWKPEQVEAVA